MIKKNIVLWCAVGSLCFLGGCGDKEAEGAQASVQKISKDSNEDSNENSNKDNNEAEFPEHMERTLSSGVVVDADIDAPKLDKREVSIYQGTALKVDTKKLSEVLLSAPITQDTQENGPDGMFYIYSGGDGAEITSVDDTWVDFSAPKFSHIQTDFGTLETEPVSDGQRDFDFVSRSEADLKIREILDLVGIEVYPGYDCVPMDHEILKEKNLENYEYLKLDEAFQEDFKKLQATPWSEDYDCYCFTYYGAVDGFKLNSKSRETDNNFVPGSVIRAVYSKDGIQSLEISDIYIGQKELEKKTLCTMDTILEAIDKKYGSIILQGDYTVTSMELVYIGDIRSDEEGYTLIPAWRCSINHKYDTQAKASSEIVNIEETTDILIDAVSGTEIYSGGTI